MSTDTPLMGRIVFAPDRRDQSPISNPGRLTAHLMAQSEAETLAALQHQVETMAEKLHKVATWLDRLAESAEANAKDCRFSSLVAAYQGDARNYRTTAADIRSVLPTAKGQG